MFDAKQHAQQRSLLERAKRIALVALQSAAQATDEARKLLTEIAREEKALKADKSRVYGGVDQPGLSPIERGVIAFEVYQHDTKKWTGESVPLFFAPMAAKAWKDLLNEQQSSKLQLRN